jgi:hypothetical protein
MPADERIFDFYIETLNRLAPNAQWCAACIGPSQYKINKWAISKRGHTRTALKNNDRLDRDTLAPSNEALVQRAVDLCKNITVPSRHGNKHETFWDLLCGQTDGLRRATSSLAFGHRLDGIGQRHCLGRGVWRAVSGPPKAAVSGPRHARKSADCPPSRGSTWRTRAASPPYWRRRSGPEARG